MSDKVTPIKPGISPKAGESRPLLAEMFRGLAERAEAGELQHFVGVGVTSDGQRISAWYLSPGHNANTMLGAVTWLQHEYIHRMTEPDE